MDVGTTSLITAPAATGFSQTSWPPTRMVAIDLSPRGSGAVAETRSCWSAPVGPTDQAPHAAGLPTAWKVAGWLAPDVFSTLCARTE